MIEHEKLKLNNDIGSFVHSVLFMKNVMSYWTKEDTKSLKSNSYNKI